MIPNREKAILGCIDFLSINLAWTIYYWFRFQSGWLGYAAEPEFVLPMLVICAFWLAVFFLFGLYKSWYIGSRVDESLTILKAVTFGILTLFFAIFIDDQGMGSPAKMRLLIAGYCGVMILCVGGGRLILHSVKRKFLEAGIGRQHAIIIGLNQQALDLYEMVKSHPALGYRVVGFVPVERRKHQESPYK